MFAPPLVLTKAYAHLVAVPTTAQEDLWNQSQRLHWTQHSEIASDPRGQTCKQNCIAGMPYSTHAHICPNSWNMLESFELNHKDGKDIFKHPCRSSARRCMVGSNKVQVVWSIHAPYCRRLGRLITQRHRKCWCRTKSQKSNQQRTSNPLECQHVQSVAKCCLILSIYIYVVPIPPSSMGRLQDVAMHPTWKNVIRSLTTFRQGKALQSQGALDTKAQFASSGYGDSPASTSAAHCTLHCFLLSVHLNVFEPTFVHHQVTIRVKSMWSQMLAALELCLGKFVQKTSQHLLLFSLCPDCIASWMQWNPHEMWQNRVELRPKPIRAALHQFLALAKCNRIRTHLHARQVQIQCLLKDSLIPVGFEEHVHPKVQFSRRNKFDQT